VFRSTATQPAEKAASAARAIGAAADLSPQRLHHRAAAA